MHYFLSSELTGQSHEQIGESWQVIELENVIYFQTEKGVYSYQDININFSEIPNTYIFKIKNNIYASSNDSKKFGILNNDMIEAVENFEILDDQVYMAP